MGHYLANFTVYTMAMLGLIFFAVFVYKKFFQGVMDNSSSKVLKIEETLSINPRKSLLVVRAGDEKFLIASDIDKTTLISKLGQETPQIMMPQNYFSPQRNVQFPMNERVRENLNETIPQRIHLDTIGESQKILRPKKQNTVVLDFDKKTNHGFSAMKEMAKKINEL